MSNLDILGPFLTDGYKIQHIFQYPEGTQRVYSNWTARGSRLEGVDKVVFFGLQYVIQKFLMDGFESFFASDKDEAVKAYSDLMDSYMGPVNSDHIAALHDLGYLPLEFKALEEGTEVPLRVPMFTVENTIDEFFWLTNYVETILSNALWMPMTSATTALQIRRIIDSWAIKTTGSTEGVGFQGHDFSMRGMAGLDSAISSAMGHLVAFTGTETVPVLKALPHYYEVNGFLAGTVPATEHSVMCAGGMESERETFERLIDLYPTGIVSIVSDTWDFWNVVNSLIPSLKDKIMAREGKLVIRPDSGDPADIICGLNTANRAGVIDDHTTDEEWKGAIELLWETFGGTVNEQGYKVLDDHIGLIYGDSMTPERIEDICSRLASKGFAISPVVFGIGSFQYQYKTRDTFGFAMKATNVTINGEEKAIFKDPKTDNGLKKSLKGRIAVHQDGSGNLIALDEGGTKRNGRSIKGPVNDALQTVWKNGKFVKSITFDEVRANAGAV